MKSSLIFNNLAFNLSVWSILALVTYDFEIFCLTSSFITWHLFKGVSTILNDYVYMKVLKLLLLLVLQVSLIELGHYFVDFLL